MPSIESSFIEVVVFRRRGAQLEFLLLQRAADEPLYPGLWQFVTGRLHGGETAVAAARREVREETGLQIRELWVVPAINAFYSVQKDEIHLTPQFAAEIDPASEVRLSHEHQAHRWAHSEEARRGVVWPANRGLIDYVEQDLLQHPELSERTRLPEA